VAIAERHAIGCILIVSWWPSASRSSLGTGSESEDTRETYRLAIAYY